VRLTLNVVDRAHLEEGLHSLPVMDCAAVPAAPTVSPRISVEPCSEDEPGHGPPYDLMAWEADANLLSTSVPGSSSSAPPLSCAFSDEAPLLEPTGVLEDKRLSSALADDGLFHEVIDASDLQSTEQVNFAVPCSSEEVLLVCAAAVQEPPAYERRQAKKGVSWIHIS